MENMESEVSYYLEFWGSRNVFCGKERHLLILMQFSDKLFPSFLGNASGDSNFQFKFFEFWSTILNIIINF